MASLAIPDDISLLLVLRPGAWPCGGQQPDEQADEQDADDIEVRRWLVDSSELVYRCSQVERVVALAAGAGEHPPHGVRC